MTSLMPTSLKKNRKRNKGITNLPSGFSKSLWDARNLIAQGQNDQGLVALNQLAVATKNPKRRAKILMLVGESQAKLSRHAEAATAFARASEYARQAADLDLLLGSGAGQIRSLLRSLRTDGAKTAAASLLAELDKAQQDYQKILSLTPAQLAASGALQIAAQPPRPTVVLTKIANAFIESGLTDDARVFLQKALTLSPNGAARARQSLAKLALASDDPALAERYARESLLMGRFQAKTITAWQLYLDARARQNLIPILEPDVFASFQANAKGRIATASIHSIARVLRAHGDPAWIGIAKAAIASTQADKVISTEMEKMIQADAKLTGSEEPRIIAARSLRMFRASDSSAKEQVSHAKAYVRYSLLAGVMPTIDTICKVASARYGNEHTIAVRHTMALGAIQARNHDLARKWLLGLLTDLALEVEAWGRATWALARMEDDLENHGEASIWYLAFAENRSAPARFRIQAMLRGLKQLTLTGGEINTTKISEAVSAILRDVDDYRVILDAARQLALAGPAFLSLKYEASERGKMLANGLLQKTKSPQGKLLIIEYLARRQAWDLGDYGSILEQWDRLTIMERAEFQATSGSLWYEYITLIFRALANNNRVDEAKLLISDIIDQDRSTSEGYVIVGSAYAVWLLENGYNDSAYEYFEWIIREAPSHRKTAVAYYWIALRCLKLAKNDQAEMMAGKLRKCFSGAPALLEEWELDVKALLILHNNSSEAIIYSGVSYTREFIERALVRMRQQINLG